MIKMYLVYKYEIIKNKNIVLKKEEKFQNTVSSFLWVCGRSEC